MTSFSYAGTAREALRQLDDAHDMWVDGVVRHEALHDRVGVEDLYRPGCRGSRVKLRAA
jgi:hypothetical protein